MNCAECGAKLPRVRTPRSLRQAMLGGGTCPNCGIELDRKGRAIGFRISKEGQTGMEVKIEFFPLSFFLFFCKPRIEIDGRTHMSNWGTHFFDLPPGRHTVKIYFRYLFMSQCGANSIDLVVRDGETCRVRYYMPPWIFVKGSLKQV